MRLFARGCLSVVRHCCFCRVGHCWLRWQSVTAGAVVVAKRYLPNVRLSGRNSSQARWGVVLFVTLGGRLLSCFSVLCAREAVSAPVKGGILLAQRPLSARPLVPFRAVFGCRQARFRAILLHGKPANGLKALQPTWLRLHTFPGLISANGPTAPG